MTGPPKGQPDLNPGGLVLDREHLRGSITVQLTSCLTGLEMPVCAVCTEFCTAQMHISKRVKQEVNCTVILPP